jgi:hypothetical protein
METNARRYGERDGMKIFGRSTIRHCAGRAIAAHRAVGRAQLRRGGVFPVPPEVMLAPMSLADRRRGCGLPP